VRQSSLDDGAKRNQHADRANEDWSRRKYKARKKSVGAKTENEGQRKLGLKHAWAQKWFVQIFGSGLICPKGLKHAWTQKWFVQILAAD